MRFAKWTLLWLAVAAAIGFALWRLATGWHPSEADYPVQGITLTEDQGEVRWPTLQAAGADFAYVRASIGAEGRDRRFVANWAAAERAGMPHGAVHVWRMCDPAAEQATNFIATVPADPDELPPALLLDLDEDCDRDRAGETLALELAEFLALIETHLEKEAVLYVTEDFDERYAVTSRIDRDLWLVRRLFPPDYGARRWSMWQASDVRAVAGVEGRARWSVARPAG